MGDLHLCGRRCPAPKRAQDYAINLTGYGVELRLKNTEYKTGDNHDVVAEIRADREDQQADEAPPDILQLQPVVNLTDVGLRSTLAILAAADPINALSTISGAFPVLGSRYTTYLRMPMATWRFARVLRLHL
eukprot:SAG31_NODE_124_length_23684_cov_7.200127_6_plen_132_part_00